ncbi:hypothetical protein O6H91_05G125500 [Diphasiastrum complanatum]|uniref:Uncharacterized protein n=3 Tax=Diphasiastrum complanatum TaxID=34168 RepID=A0ACC2DTH2_DIPCM|nr:hypothetical protein O6H91_05G125500 [Diphasiastrum complanatum]KAJ7557405.1 hypothetical protein O6H91_05G125500 [Diphasiastrum complanatum]KAJ7557406.1 hypothetical protein O6H91_05G125500 [Diphasiastrum complanatum]
MPFSALKSVKFDRWLGLAAAMIMMSCGGLNYAYGVYSEHMKEKLHYSQEQIDDIGAAKDLGQILSLISGLLYNLYPPWATVVIGAGMHFIGYNMVWLTLLGKTSPSFWLLCLYFALGNGGDGWIDTACIMTSLQNFKEHRGTAMGILKSEVGLSGAIFVMIYEVFLEPNVDQFVLLLSLAPTVISILLAFFIRPFVLNEQDNDEELHQRFQMTYGVMILLGIYLFISMMAQEFLHIGKIPSIFMAMLMGIIMLVMFVMPVFATHFHLLKLKSKQKQVILEIDLVPLSSSKDHEEKSDLSPLVMLERQLSWENAHEIADQSPQTCHKKVKKLKEVVKISATLNTTLSECLLGVDFWLATLIITTGAGTGLAIINNFAQIAKAAGRSDADLFIGLISISNCFGRLAAGYGSDHLLRHGYPRPICLVIAQVTMCICCLTVATGLMPFLYIGSALTGFAYGAFWSLCPAVISEVFGLNLFASLYKLISIGPPIGSYLLSAKLVGVLYDQEAAWYQKQFHGTLNIPLEANICQGQRCFALAMLSLAIVCMIGVVASIVFWMHTKHVYSSSKAYELL